MAKKRKVKKKKTKVKRATKKAKSISASASPTQSAYMLSITGSIIVIIAGIFSLISETFAATNVIAVLPIIFGIILLIATFGIRKKPRLSAIIILLFSIAVLSTKAKGLIAGPVLTLLASVILLLRK